MRERHTVNGSVGMMSAGRRGSSGHHPMVVFVVGVGFLVLFTVGFMTQIQTNEAFVQQSGSIAVYKPNWAILMQLPNLVMGNLSAGEAAATIFGYGIELIYLGFIVGYGLLEDAVSASGQVMARIFVTGAWGIVIFNLWTDYTYGTFGGGFWGHVGFAAATSFIVGFFGTIGVYLVRAAWRRA